MHKTFDGIADSADLIEDKLIRSLPKHEALSKVQVNSEDGILREVIYGCVEDFILPDGNSPIWSFAGGRFLELAKENPNMPFSEADPKWFKEIQDCVENVVEFLEARDIVVHRPNQSTLTEKKNFSLNSRFNCNLYNRDSIFAIGNTLVEASFKTPERNRNKYTVRDVTMPLLKKGSPVVSCPQSMDTYYHNDEESPLIEGGDVMIDGDNIYVGYSGMATNTLGIEWLQRMFPEKTVYQINIRKAGKHQHLDCVMVAFEDWGIYAPSEIDGYINMKTKEAIAYDPDSLEERDESLLPPPLRDKSWGYLSLHDAHAKLGNFIAISPREILIAEEATEVIKEIDRLNAQKIIGGEIIMHQFPYKAVGDIGGSFRCNTCPIYRHDEFEAELKK